MLLRFSCILLLYLLVDFENIDCAKFGSSRSSSSGSSRSSSSGSSRPSNYGSSRSTHFGSSNSASHGSYGWRTTSKPYTTHRYSTRRHYPITTMPTHKFTTRRYVVTTLPTRKSTTRRHYPITTMPTRSSTRKYITTMPTHKITRQPPYNPFYSTTHRSSYNNSQSRQPPHNPFLSSSTTHKPFISTTSKSSYNNSQSRQPPFNPFFSTTTTRQPPYNPFFSTQARNNGSNVHRTTPSTFFNRTTTRQPPYNPFFSTQGRNNGTILHQTTPSTFFSTRTTPKPGLFQNHSRPNAFNNHTGIMTPKPILVGTTKVVPVGSGIRNNSRPVTPLPNNNWRPTSSSNIYTTQSPKFTRPNWNNTSSHGNFGPNTHQPIYRPPGAQNNTFVSRPTYITGTHPNYNPHTNHPTNTGPGTTIINNNNHYYPGHIGSTTPHVTIINNNNYYNPNHHVIIPSRHYYSYGPPAVGISIVNTDYYSHPISPYYTTTYHYRTVDTGNSLLGFYLGYQLGKISRPSYYYHSTSYVNNEYIPRYDHYTVHHYYHNSENVPKEAPIQPNAVVVCPGDSGSLCPAGNMPFCTNNGAVMCVVSAQSTEPCTDNQKQQTNCVRSTISCNGNESPECKQKSEATVSIPCVSTAKIDAGVDFINNSLIVTNPNDLSTKSFCVTILALPTQSKNATQTNTKPQQTTEFSLPFHYTTNDTGVGLLGYYLGNKLKKLAEPSYFYLNYDANFTYVEKYDHYNVFHYDHDGNVLPQIVEVRPDLIMTCAGDSGTFCPQNTTSLCLNDGAVVCVTESSITSYNEQLKTNYIYTNISCIDLKSPACIATPNDTIKIDIPCISTVKLYAKTSYLIKSYGTGNNTIYYKTLEPIRNGSSIESIESPRELCATILALPGEKIVLKSQEKKKVRGIPNAINAFSLPKYTYQSKETGDNLLGYYLKDKLNTISYPTYYWINAYLYRLNGEVQKYDHYSVHYYEYGKEILPSDLELQASEINGCEGDSGLLCPEKTNSVCLKDGSLWCITDLLLTSTCKKYNNTACIKTKVTVEKTMKKVMIGCVATLTILGDITAVNNTIYKYKSTAAQSYMDIQMMNNGNNNTNKAQHFCVSLVNIPVERKLSDGEKLFENSESVFGKIASKIFG